LCADTKLILESFTIPDTWNNQGFNQSAVPQYKFGVTTITFPGGQSNVSKTATVPVPADCKNTQLDFYYPPAYESIIGLTDDDARYIGGRIFGRTQSSCTVATPVVTPAPTPTPTPSPVTLPASVTPAPPTPTPSPTPQISVACVDLVANVATGNAPLAVTFTGRGQASGQSISQYLFDFGNNDGVSGSSSVVNYTYTQPGTYTATLKVKGSLSGQSGDSDACSVTIKVTGTGSLPASITPTPRPQIYLPQTGVTGPLMTFVGALLITGGLLHVWLTSRNKLLVVPKRR
jgi:LPXTG-motif cell wall-anchored protein